MPTDLRDTIKALSAAQYVQAFQHIEPTKSQWNILRAHLTAPGRASTARGLARALGYAKGRAVNLVYGRFAGKLCAELGVSPKHKISVFVTFDKADDTEWILVLRPAVIEALTVLGMAGGRPDHSQ